MTGPINCKKIFWELWNKCMWPTGMFHKRPKALLLLCAIMVAAHSVTALWQQFLSDLMLSDVLLIIMNRLRSSMLHVLVSAAVGIHYMEKTLLLWLSYSVWFSWWEAPSSKMKYYCPFQPEWACFYNYGGSGFGRTFTLCWVQISFLKKHTTVSQ